MRAYRLSWWLTFWGLLTSLSLNWVLPALDHHAAEYNPFHTHHVLGGGSAAERDALLAAHQHGAGHPHDHHDPAGAAGTIVPEANMPAIVSISALDGVLSRVANAAEVLAALAAPLPLPPLALWLAVGALSLFRLRPPDRPPETPPRFAV